MLFAAHIIAAGTIGEKVGNPFLAFLIGIILHLCLDIVPHYDTTDKGKATLRQWLLAIADAFIGFLVVLFIMKPHLSYGSSFLWGAVGGVIIDIFDVFPYWRAGFRRTGIGKIVHRIHAKYHAQGTSFVLGMLTQLIVILISLAIYFKIL